MISDFSIFDISWTSLSYLIAIIESGFCCFVPYKEVHRLIPSGNGPSLSVLDLVIVDNLYYNIINKIAQLILLIFSMYSSIVVVWFAIVKPLMFKTTWKTHEGAVLYVPNVLIYKSMDTNRNISGNREN